MGCIPSHNVEASTATNDTTVTPAVTAELIPVVECPDSSAENQRSNTTSNDNSHIHNDNSMEKHNSKQENAAIETIQSAVTQSNEIQPQVRTMNSITTTTTTATATTTTPTVEVRIVPKNDIDGTTPGHIATATPPKPSILETITAATKHKNENEETFTSITANTTTTATTTTTTTTARRVKRTGYVDKSSPSVGQSSMAVTSSSRQPRIATNNNIAKDKIHNQDTTKEDANKNNEGSGTTRNNSTAVLQKISEGSGEAIHHLRNIFATPISFAIHAVVEHGTAVTDGISQRLGGTNNNDSNNNNNNNKHRSGPEPTSQAQHYYTMPLHRKSDTEMAFLQTVLQKHYLFESQSKSSLFKLIQAFEKYTITIQDPHATQVMNDNDNNRTDTTNNTTTQYTVDIIQQGEEVMGQTRTMNTSKGNNVEQDKAYFYIVYSGQCQITVDDEIVGMAHRGDAFGELALLYNGQRAATVTALLQSPDTSTSERNQGDETIPVTDTGTQEDFSTVVLFRVHQRSFRIILQQDDQDMNHVTMNLLDNIEFLNTVPISVKENLARVMVPFPFQKGDHILQKGIMDCPWTVIERGSVLATNLEHGYQDFVFHEGQCFGERAIVANAPAIGDVYAETAGVAFTVDATTFRTLVGNSLDSTNAISRAQDISKLQAINVLSTATQTNERVLNYLAKQIVDHTFTVGEVICHAGQPLLRPPALYLVRKGVIRLDHAAAKTPQSIEMDAFFGDDQLCVDMHNEKYTSPYTATVIEECSCGILKLRDCRNVMDTRRMGKKHNVLAFDSLSLSQQMNGKLSMDDLSVHRMIGAGTFGQVFLVSRKCSDGNERAYALKVQSKYELCRSGQAKGVVREKNIMTLLHNPFVATLLASFQDDKCVYMLMNLLQGGELFSIMHTKTSHVLPERSAKFYAACVAEALFYLHCSHALVFRDLKPENIMIDNNGYAILIDYGFCKKISGKTYTTCGTPLYLAPEVILNRGHSWSVDYWSLGIMIYEMLVGKTPFYENGMNKAELFENIVRGKVYPPTDVSPEALSLLSGLLRRDPTKRLGSLLGNENEIIDHPWFNEIDRDLLFLKELNPPFIPKIKDPFDASNFSNWKHVSDKRSAQYPDLTKDEEEIFRDF
jgi:CRP-like cAMP-binding protein